MRTKVVIIDESVVCCDPSCDNVGKAGHLHECIQRVAPRLAVGVVVLRHCARVNGARVRVMDGL